MGGGAAPTKDTKTILVLGAAYGGAPASQILAAGLPEGWKLIVVDRNSHIHHVYAMPRFAVLPEHEYKAFIPYTNVFLKPQGPLHFVLQAHVTSIRPHHITLSKAFPEHGIPTNVVAFDFALYALGSKLPSPLDLWGTSADGKPVPQTDGQFGGSAIYRGQKSEGCAWFKEKQKVIEKAPSVLVVGGGALGVQFATDIKTVYPSKKVTLLHSRTQLLNRFKIELHDEVIKTCKEIDVKVILGERLDLDSVEDLQGGHIQPLKTKIVRTVTGREISADLLMLCTGQAPNTALLKAMDPDTINDSNHLVHVLRTMQICPIKSKASKPSEAPDVSGDTVIETLENLSLGSVKHFDGSSESQEAITTPYPHIFAAGDAADAFGAIMAGHTAHYQGAVAARNILRLVKRQEAEAEYEAAIASGKANIQKPEHEPLEKYTPGLPAIKVSLGIKHAVYQEGTKVGTNEKGVPDMHVRTIWPLFGLRVEKDEDMRV